MGEGSVKKEYVSDWGQDMGGEVGLGVVDREGF